MVLLILLCLFNLSLTARRLHDTNRSAMIIIPIYIAFISLKMISGIQNKELFKEENQLILKGMSYSEIESDRSINEWKSWIKFTNSLMFIIAITFSGYLFCFPSVTNNKYGKIRHDIFSDAPFNEVYK